MNRLVLRWMLAGWLFLGVQSSAFSQVVMDVFPGWDKQMLSDRWNFVVVEISNQGIPINAILEVVSDQAFAGSLAVSYVEIPSKTNKRMWIYLPPMAFPHKLKVRLLDHRKKLIVEQACEVDSKEATTRLIAESLPLGWPRMNFDGVKVGEEGPSWKSVRMLKQHLPDALVGYDGLVALHLGWSDLGDLNPSQLNALAVWIAMGGHLIASTDSPMDWKQGGFWMNLLPLSVDSQKPFNQLLPLPVWTGPKVKAFEDYVENQKNSETLIGYGTQLRGRVSVEKEGIPLICEARVDRGWVTQLLFNPSHEPFRGWRGKSAFWLQLLQSKFDEADQRVASASKDNKGAPFFNPYSSSRLEDLISLALSTKRPRSLSWFLLSLFMVGFIVLIGPFDYVYLKRKKKLVWTWVTFPAYAITFTLLIYGIGHLTNSGDSDWRQWTVMDWLKDVPRQRAVTMMSFFSARNASYQWGDEKGMSTQIQTLSETSGYESSQTLNRAEIVCTPAGSQVDAAIPVWTSLRVLGHFDFPQARPLESSYDESSGTLTLRNPTSMDWKHGVWVVSPGEYYELGNLAAGEQRSWSLKSMGVGAKKSLDWWSAFHDHDGGGDPEYGAHQGERFVMMTQGLSFFADHTRGNFGGGSLAGQGLDLSLYWRKGDGLFLACSEAPEHWPWRLQFLPKHRFHKVVHRIYFPKERILNNSAESLKPSDENPSFKALP